MTTLYYLLFFSISSLLQQCRGIEPPIVTLKQGILQGKYEVSLNGRQFAAFRGIPYAKPPLGKYRFKESVAAGPWLGTYKAITKPNECIQYDLTLAAQKKRVVHGSEDCLYINVFTPKLKNGINNENLMDVIVYIHGGGFMFSSSNTYGPRFLMDKDVVFVNFNYRLGAIGFLSTEDDLLPGNNGLKDQVLALKWVQENIAAFGGNPDSVTLAGMSAGGASVHYHLLSPLSTGLFKYAISASGTALCPWAQAESLREKTFTIAKELGCPTQDSRLVDCLRQRPAEDIVKTSSMFVEWLSNPVVPFGPVIEKPSQKAFISMQPLEAIKKKKYNDVPWLVSFTSDEGLFPGAEILCNESNFDSLISGWENAVDHLLDLKYTVNPTFTKDVKNKIWMKYLSGDITSQKKGLVEMLSDRMFLVGTLKAAKEHSLQSGSPVYVFQFSYRGKSSLSDIYCPAKDMIGVCHGDDLAYITSDFIFDPSENGQDRSMITEMVNLWVSFSSTGKPKFGTTSDSWPSFKENSEFQFLDIKSPELAEVTRNANIGNEDFWDSLKINENIDVNKNLTKEEL